MVIEKAECGISVGDEISPDNPLHRCSALGKRQAEGLKYSHELGLLPEKRTQLVDSIYELACRRARGGVEGQEVDPYCLYLRQLAVAEVVEMAEADFEPHELREAIAGLPLRFRWAAETAVSSYLRRV